MKSISPRPRHPGTAGSITADQQREIVRWKDSGHKWQEIADHFNCTIDAARHYYRLIAKPGYVNRHREISQKRSRINRGIMKVFKNRKQRADLTRDEQKAIAAKVLAIEIQMAKAEVVRGAKPYKSGPLEW